METQWASRAFQSEHVVCNLKLRPYSCGHEITLCQIESPFVLGGDYDWPDLFTAVLLCANKFEEGQRLIRNPKRARFFQWLWKLRNGKSLILPLELEKFRQYLDAGMWAPDTHSLPAKSSRTLKAPRAYRLIAFLCSNLGLTEAQALDFPIARANAYYAAVADKNGEIELSTTGRNGSEDEVLMKHLADLEERAAKGEPVWQD